MLLLSHFSSVPPGFPSLGFSRQEHWSGLSFPSPMHESEVTQSCPTLSNPMDCNLPGSSIHGIFQSRVLEWGAISFSVLAHSSRYNGHWNLIHPFPSILVHWFLKCWCSLLPSPVWPHPIYLDSWTYHSRFPCNIVLYGIRLYFHHQSHPQRGVVLLWLCFFILSGVISPLFSSSILGTYIGV